MTKKKVFITGFLTALFLVFGACYVWDKVKPQSFDVWSYYPDAKKLEEAILEKRPIGTPVAWLMRDLEFTDLEFKGGQSEGGHFKGYEHTDSCCGFYFSASRDDYLNWRYETIVVKIEFDENQNTTFIYVGMGDFKLQLAP